MGNNNKKVEKPEFTELDLEQNSQKKTRNLDLLLDIPLEVSVELGRTKLTVKEAIQLTKGSIIELNKLDGEPVDIFVNGKFIANGEVVIIEERFGVRIKEIVDKKERINRLK